MVRHLLLHRLCYMFWNELLHLILVDCPLLSGLSSYHYIDPFAWGLDSL